MLKETLQLLASMNAYNCSEDIEIAKGKYSIPKTFKDVLKKFIREIKYTKK